MENGKWKIEQAQFLQYAIFNADMNPTNLEVNRKYAPHFDVVIIKGTGDDELIPL